MRGFSLRRIDLYPESDAHVVGELEFCKQFGCPEFAQTSDPKCSNTLKFYCPAHEAKAIDRGETGARVRDGHLMLMPSKFPNKLGAKGKPLYQFSIEGNLVARHENTLIAAEETGLNYDCLRNAAVNGKPYMGFLWSRAAGVSRD